MNNSLIKLAGKTTHLASEFLILNVDDTEAARYAKTRVLTKAGFQVIEAETGYDALILAAESLPDLILLDTKLPDINGFEVCRKLKENPLTYSIVILQTSASFIKTTDKIAALDGGADNYLFEPIEPEELIANIIALIRLSYAEKEIREVNKRKDVFLATLAHELRNPLGPIKNSVRLLQNYSNSEELKNSELLEIISRQTNQMARLIDDLLDVSRISQGKISLQKNTVSVSDFVNAAVESSAQLIKDRGHTLDLEIAKNSLWIDGDHVRLVQIVSNLLNNAAKFTPSGGLIKLIVSEQDSKLLIEVIDNGIGLESDQIDSIFELFVQHGKTEERAFEGLGIGLSLVKNLVELHEAEISVSSQGYHLGSSFKLKFKLASTPDKQLEQQEAAIKVPKISKILVIDDNIDAANTLSELLTLIGHEVKTAYSGRSGIELAKNTQLDIIFLDIGLPDMTGYDVAKELKTIPNTKNIYLIALTGYGTESDQIMAINSGFNLHLTKPLDYEKIESINLGL